MSSRCSTAPVAASPASFQPSKATTATASVSRGRSSEVCLGSITPPSLRRSEDTLRVAGTNVADGGEGSPDRWIGGAGPGSAPDVRAWPELFGDDEATRARRSAGALAPDAAVDTARSTTEDSHAPHAQSATGRHRRADRAAQAADPRARRRHGDGDPAGAPSREHLPRGAVRRLADRPAGQ